MTKPVKPISDRPKTSESSSMRDSAQHLSTPSQQRQAESLNESPFDLEQPSEAGTLVEVSGGERHPAPSTVLYLAYGSNLCRQTFQGNRNIKPLSAVNVVVPELILTFDLAGIPYVEPCFANTKYSDSSRNPPRKSDKPAQQTPLLPQTPAYKNPCWPKGLVGVVYEVTIEDYAHIIATEGGGSSYKDILVDCYTLASGSSTVPKHPEQESKAFRAHTLYSPVYPPGSKKPKDSGRFSRPDPDYAQPSPRYLKLITDGADEHDLPAEYKAYLHELQPYIATSRRQIAGQKIFTRAWMPILLYILSLNKRFANDKGKSPKWLTVITGAVFSSSWATYDLFFKRVFGDGERTQKREENQGIKDRPKDELGGDDDDDEQ